MQTFMATRLYAHTETHGRNCGRCGLDFTPGHNVEESRAEFCKDCRPEATLLGWCEPKKNNRQLQAA